ncbi:hypothetical protein F970_02423 [Acinetobacter sp. CIP 102082]|uniref:DUF1285 domain-containing protein n=1 Tax=unclassified Acinetobacter TaxID=196816 RepID=UPI0002CFF1E0|nr:MULTISPECIES: DUF1285 domain-containing protein [unclassified Acinetobacter]ENU90496.1 hypothetical protein F972_00230 [Acinetobacter sp. CIP 102529]ENU94954.1 hypothetical protein F970_02423 [Acinetobacter sp. CIP 102082]ENX66544.1 hypothetical protein F884_00920 [Acinetobacter sp. CIP 102143]
MINENDSSQNPLENQGKIVFPDDRNLMSIAQYVKDVQQSHKRSIPPLDQWHPKHCGKMDLKIKANGEWWHEGQLIKRQALLDLFSKVLWKEDGKFYLKTPVEQIEIEVEDEPLLINQVDQVEIEGKTYLQLTTSNQDVVIVDERHPVFMRAYPNEAGEDELRPYVHVRFGMNALIQRQSFYHLVNYGSLSENARGETVLTLKSGDLVLHLST